VEESGAMWCDFVVPSQLKPSDDVWAAFFWPTPPWLLLTAIQPTEQATIFIIIIGGRRGHFTHFKDIKLFGHNWHNKWNSAARNSAFAALLFYFSVACSLISVFSYSIFAVWQRDDELFGDLMAH